MTPAEMNDERARAAAIQLSKCSQKGRDALASAGVPMNDVASGLRPARSVSPERAEELTREVNIERALDRVGRERVFEYVRSLNWPSGTMVPHWVWEAACAHVASERAQPEATPNMEGE